MIFRKVLVWILILTELSLHLFSSVPPAQASVQPPPNRPPEGCCDKYNNRAGSKVFFYDPQHNTCLLGGTTKETMDRVKDYVSNIKIGGYSVCNPDLWKLSLVAAPFILPLIIPLVPISPIILVACNVPSNPPQSCSPLQCNPLSDTCAPADSIPIKWDEHRVQNPTCPTNCGEASIFTDWTRPSTWGRCYAFKNGSPDYTQQCAKNNCGTDPAWAYYNGKCIQIATFQWAGLSIINKADCNGVPGVDTAIGCIPTSDPGAFLTFVLKYVFALSGGIIMIMLIVTGFSIVTSQGNPEKLQAAKENVVSLIAGLVLIVFSLVLLHTIGADILNLPTFK